MAEYDPARDLNAGADYANALTLAERKNAAYAALRKVYGDVAGDPEAALQMQTYGYNEKAAPLKLEGLDLSNQNQDLQNQGQVEANAFNKSADPLKLQQLSLGNEGAQQQIDQSAQAFPLEQEQKRASIASTRANTASTQQGTDLKRAAQERQAGLAMIGALKATATSGGDVGAVFDRFAPVIAKMEGVDPNHLGPLRAAILQDPANTLNSLETALTAPGASGAHVSSVVPATDRSGNQGSLITYSDGHQEFRAGATPFSITKESLPSRQAGVEYKTDAKGNITGKVVPGTPQADKQQQAADQRAAQASALQVTQERTRAVPSAVQAAVSLISQMSGSGVVRRARAHIPDTPEYQFEQYVKQIGTNLSLDDLRSLRASGTSLGRVTNTEFVASSHAFANLDLGQDPRTLASNLQRIGETYGRINDNLSSDIKRLNGGKTPSKQDEVVDYKTYFGGK